MALFIDFLCGIIIAGAGFFICMVYQKPKIDDAERNKINIEGLAGRLESYPLGTAQFYCTSDGCKKFIHCDDLPTDKRIDFIIDGKGPDCAICGKEMLYYLITVDKGKAGIIR